NAANENTVASKSGDTTRPPTKEEMQAAYADMQKGFSGQNALQHINDAAEYVTNAATPQNNTQGKTQTATTTVTAQTQSRDARVRENYRARQQAEADARYEDFDIEAAEAKLRDNAYWTDRLLESRKQGYGFAGDEQIAEERNTLEEEIKRAKDAADRRRERYIREKAAQMPDNGLHELLRWSVRNMPERKQDTFSVSPQFSNTLYPEISPGYSNGSIPQKNYYTKNKSIYGENTDKAPDAISNILTATSLVPGIDTFADAAAIPVDLLRGDYISAGLDAFGILPFVGEVADTAKLARAGMNVADVAHDAGKAIDAVKTVDIADDVADAVKTADDVFDYSKFPQKIHEGRQGKHIIGHNNYIPGKSITTVSNDRLLELMKTKVGTGTPYAGREVIDFGEVIGKYVDEITGEAYDTTIATVHYSQDGFHIIPAAPKEWRR
ncbi:MAG: hypothetical protein IJ949_06080, partial [Oscillospiraceae bacterium]|nr:hypothetical protein [Oscillospiraceae bacterium]